MSTTPPDAAPPTFLRTFIPTLLFVLLCGIVGPIFLLVGFLTDEPDTGWLIPVGLLITISDVVAAVLIARVRTRSRRRAHRLRTAGRGGRAQILAIDPTNVRINDQPLMKLRLLITGDDLTPFEVEEKRVIPTYRLPFLAGDVPVLVDPETQEWEFDWASATLRDAPPVTPAALAAVSPPVEASAADRLAELDDLLHRDLISRDEYDATRARILDEI